MLIRRFVGLLALAALSAALGSSCAGAESSDPTPAQNPDSGTDAISLTDGSWACSPKSCAELQADCGETSDGCGDLVSCGSCPSGQTCGAAGPNRCGVGACTPSSCASAGAECGLIGDGCGKSLDCGSCVAPKVCSAGGQANKCGCTPTTCAAAGKDCGSMSNGCGGTLDCGACPAGKKCGAGGVPNVCACEPTTCAAQAKTCGTIPNGCGGILDCGGCTAPKTCGGLGTPNVCGCSPANCPPIYQNSFESTGDFPAGWLSWQNCPTDTTWTAAREQYPAPNGGSWGLRLHTTGFVVGCQYPGVYALSPPIAALPARDYRVQSWSRNAGNVGVTGILFFDSADKEIGGSQVTWTTDAWQYGADPALTATSPANTKTLRIRYALQTASEFADLDLLEVYLEPP